MTLGVQFAGRLPLLLFPVLALLLAVVWMHSDVRIGEIGAYIRDRIAPRFTDLGDWEVYIRQKNSRRVWFRPVELSALGVFAVTELLSVALVEAHQVQLLLAAGNPETAAAPVWQKVS